MGFFERLIGVAPLAAKARGLNDTERALMEEWYATSVARYPGAAVDLSEIYDGWAGGKTLLNYLRQHASADVNIRESDLRSFLTGKGHPSNHVNGKLRFHGIRQIAFGNVRSGNYGT